MMNNMPPQSGLIGSQPVAYSRMPNDSTQNIINRGYSKEPNSPNPNENLPTSELRIKRKKVLKIRISGSEIKQICIWLYIK